MQHRSAEQSITAPLEIVGSSLFGRHPKISIQTVYNMFMVDDFLSNFSGYSFILAFLASGRGIYSSQKGNLLFLVSANQVFMIDKNLFSSNIFSLTTDSGDVFIDEDLLGNIAFCDGTNIYIYNYVTNINYIVGTNVTLVGNLISPLDFVPNYVCFHDGSFLATSSRSGSVQVGQWRISSTVVVSGITYIIFPASAQFQGGFQTKPDLPIAIARFPGRENQIIVMGTNVTEVWNDTGAALFRYQRNTGFDVDFGCINPATVAELNNLVVWLGINERSGPTIMYTIGQDIKSISTDGINYLMSNLNKPQVSYGFSFIEAGHMFYVLTFYDPSDNISLVYDFTTEKFFNLCDEDLNFFIAKRAVLFNNKYYFVSITDGNLYQIGPQFTEYTYETEVKEIPRSIMMKTFRPPGGVPRIFNNFYFIVEQGIDSENTGQGNNIKSIILTSPGFGYTTCTALIQGDGKGAYATVTINPDKTIASVNLVDVGVGYSWAVVTLIGDGFDAFADISLNVNDYVPRVDLSIAYDGGYLWSNFDQMQLTEYGRYKSRFFYDDLGYGNEFTLQFRIWCKSRFLLTNGEMAFY